MLYREKKRSRYRARNDHTSRGTKNVAVVVPTGAALVTRDVLDHPSPNVPLPPPAPVGCTDWYDLGLTGVVN